MLGIFLQLSKQTTFLFTFPENRKQNWNVCWYSVVNFEMRRLPELAAWITQFFQNRHQKKWRAWKDFFYEKKIFFFRQNIIESHHLKKILMIHHKLCEIWRKKFLFSGLRLTNHREWHQNIKVSSTFSEFLFTYKNFWRNRFPYTNI